MTAIDATPERENVLAKIEEIILNQGLEVIAQDEDSIQARDPESGIIVAMVLENDVLFLTVNLITVPEKALTNEVLRKMVHAENGISTSSFQTYPLDGGKVIIALNNFCKIFDMGSEDEDDVIACIDFLVADVFSARSLLGELASSN